jgi:hypothetical protein
MLDRSQKEFDVRGGRGPGEIGDLHVRFVIPDGGAFGRDKTVSVDEASAAQVPYVLDGQRIGADALSDRGSARPAQQDAHRWSRSRSRWSWSSTSCDDTRRGV